MSNYYDSRLNDNDQQRSNQQGTSRVVEIPVIHCTPSENKQQQQQPHHHHHHHQPPPPPQTQSYSPSSSRFYQHQPQHSPSQRTGYFDQPLITDDFNAPFDHFDSAFPRRFFQDPLTQGSPIDEFFSRSPFDTGRRSPHTINAYPQHRFASDYHKSPLGSPKNSPKLSPRFEKSQTPTRTTSTNTESQQENPPSPPQQHQHHHHHHHPHHQQQQQPSASFTIPVNYVKTDHHTQNREKSPYTPADIPFSSYSSSPKPETPSVAEQLANYRREQQQQQQQQDRQRSPGPQQQQQPKQTTTTTDTRRSPSPKESTNMGGSNQKQTGTQLPSDFIKSATDAANMNTPPRSTTPVRVVKTSQEKIDEISVRLASLDKDVDGYVGVEGKKDRQFLLLEENLTQCLLKLDEIDRDNDDINKQRRALIKNTQAIIDKLESKIRSKKDKDEEEQQQDEDASKTTNNSDKSNENNSDNNNQTNNNNSDNNKTETN